MCALDFTSSLYLGLEHESDSLKPWNQFTTGKPAALKTVPCARSIAQEFANLQGVEGAMLAPSTLHLFWDLFGMFADKKVAIYWDAEVYPVVRWGVERASACGVYTRRFKHHDPDAIFRQLVDLSYNLRPLIVTDGFCPSCGRMAPLNTYMDILRPFGGYLIIDDTQALGIFGYSPRSDLPYGKGGGGSLRWCNIQGHNNVIMASSLAKGFGVPLAILSGSRAMVQHFESKSETRVHSSPPSIPVVYAARHTLAVNQKRGEILRSHLMRLVCHFRKRLSRLDIFTKSKLFPVQTIRQIPTIDTGYLYVRLIQLGIKTVLLRSHEGDGKQISFIITAFHSLADIDHAVNALAYATKMT